MYGFTVMISISTPTTTSKNIDKICLIFERYLSISIILKGLNLYCREYLRKFCSTNGILSLGGVCFCPQQYMCLFSPLQILFWKWMLIFVFLIEFFSFPISSSASLLQAHESTGKQSQFSEIGNQMVKNVIFQGMYSANIFESGPMATTWKVLDGPPLLPSCTLG